MASQIEIDAMRRAIDAAAAVPRTLPNPRVGCVLLAPDGREIAVGVHRGAGHPHAETDALAQAGGAARGATAVVTLEPCHHTGRTGPCDRALVDAGVARVVFAASDPTVAAAGGADQLRSWGVEVEAGVLVEDAAGLNIEWAFAMTAGRPFVTWKFAATLDGRSAAPDGTSRWITGPQARRDVHLRRAECDAIVVGTGTVLADDPQLTVRDADDRPIVHQPLRVVVGTREIPHDSRVLDATAATVVLATAEPAEALAQLADREIRHVWLEGGPRLAGGFWDAGLIDRVVGYVAPALLGAGKPAIETAAGSIGDLRRLHVDDITVIGGDVRVIGRPLEGNV
jgi:diaminohydroxyphosphoribosylaminopyrimidine deaminase/5-amino-6-(5-phosphoribosylamino)uracil reductase